MRLGAVIVFLFLLTSAIYSQTPDSTISLKQVEVMEVKPSINYTTSSIDSNILISNSEANLDEILIKSSDIFIKEYGPGALSTLSFRGMGSSHTKIYWNGISLNSSMNGTFDLSLFNTNSADQIDIHYGASSLIDGSGSLGGSVKLGQNDAFGKGSEVQISQTIGSFSTYKTLAKLKYSWGRLFADVRFAIYSSENDFEYLNPSKPETPKETMVGAQYNGTSITGNAGWLVNKKNVINIKYIHQNSNRNLPKLNLQDSVKEFQKDKLDLGFLEWRNYSKWFKSELKIGLKSIELDYENEHVQLKSESTEKNLFIQERIKYNLPRSIKANSLFLYDYTEAFNDKYGLTRTRNEFQMIHDFQTTAGKKWKAGILVKSHFTDNVSLPFLPSANLGYKAIKDWLSISTNVSYHGAIPTMNDLYWGEGGNPNLNAESGISTELNFKGSKVVQKLNLDYRLSSYYSDIEDWILWSPDNTGIWRVSNVSRVQSYGLEANLGVAKKIKKSFISLKLAYNWNVSIDESNRQLLYVPVHRLRFNANAEWKNIGLNYNHQFTDLRYINSENNAWLPSYFLADISIYYSIALKKKSKIRLSGKVNNLYDEPYQSIANRPMPGRYYSFTLAYQLK